MIYRFQPFSTNKKLGEVYNGHCALVPNDDDWIQIMDWDAMLLTRDGYQIIDKAIARYPDTDIFGAVTNRVGYSYQRYQGIVSEDDSIKNHVRIADELSRQYSNGECDDIFSVAGFFMLFKKSYWKQHPFIETIINKGGMTFDRAFCRSTKNIKLIKGLYVFHQYRLLTGRKNIDHLKSTEV
jgi:hypothetical protein